MLALLAVTAAARAPLDRPNIVVLFVDDLGYGDVGFNGHPTTKTPTIDRLAYGGKVLSTWYSGCPVCSCSRASLLTGRQWSRMGVTPVYGPTGNDGMPLNETTFADGLRQVGYATGALGKWHLGQRAAYLPAARGFDEYLGVPYSDDMGNGRATPCTSTAGVGVRVLPSDSDKPPSVVAMEPYVAANLAPPPPPHDPGGDFLPLVAQHTAASGEVETRVVEQPLDFSGLGKKYSDFAIDFIERHADHPFLLYVPFSHVHTTTNTQPEKQYAGCPWGSPPRTFKNSTRRGAFGDALAEVDAIVASMVGALEAQAIDKNTLILFTGDNGPWLVQGASGGSTGLFTGRYAGYWNVGKGSTWEGGIREAGFAYWPGMIPPHSRSAAVVSSMDVLPTAFALAGAPLPAERKYDGRSIVDVLLHEEAPSPHTSLFFYGGAAGKLQPSAARYGPYKAHWATGPGLSGCKPGPEAPAGCPSIAYTEAPLIFNVEVDPSEAYPLVNGSMPHSPELIQLVSELQALYKAEIASLQPYSQPPAPDGPGEGPGLYAVCCNRTLGCNCDS